jgi:hypothetical protein
MKSFLKALRYAWPYRGRILLSWLCAVVGAFLWVGSLGALGPMFSLLFREPTKGIRLFQRPLPTVKTWALYVPWQWQVKEDKSLDTFQLDEGARTVLVAPDTLVIRNQAPDADQAGLSVFVAGKYHAETDLRARPLLVDGDRIRIQPGLWAITDIPEKDLALEVSRHWLVVPDPTQDTFDVQGDTVRVSPRIPIVVQEEGLHAMARQAHSSPGWRTASPRSPIMPSWPSWGPLCA